MDIYQDLMDGKIIKYTGSDNNIYYVQYNKEHWGNVLRLSKRPDCKYPIHEYFYSENDLYNFSNSIKGFVVD